MNILKCETVCHVSVWFPFLSYKLSTALHQLFYSQNIFLCWKLENLLINLIHQYLSSQNISKVQLHDNTIKYMKVIKAVSGILYNLKLYLKCCKELQHMWIVIKGKFIENNLYKMLLYVYFVLLILLLVTLLSKYCVFNILIMWLFFHE